MRVKRFGACFIIALIMCLGSVYFAYAEDSSVVSYLDYVYSDEILNQQSNIEVGMNESYLFLFQMNSNRFSLNNANTLILGTRLRDTIQYATTGISQGYMGYVDIRTEVHFADGTSKLSDWVTVSVDNNNPVFDSNGVPTVPRWSLQDENADFNWEFDLRDKHDTHIVSIVVLQNFHSQELEYERWSFWMRAQITDFSIVFNSAKDVIDAVNGSTDKITGAINDQTQDITDKLDDLFTTDSTPAPPAEIPREDIESTEQKLDSVQGLLDSTFADTGGVSGWVDDSVNSQLELLPSLLMIGQGFQIIFETKFFGYIMSFLIISALFAAILGVGGLITSVRSKYETKEYREKTEQRAIERQRYYRARERYYQNLSRRGGHYR